MSIDIRPAEISDMDQLLKLLLADAESRNTVEPLLWKIDTAPHDKIYSAVTTAIQAENPPFRQQWLVADDDGELVGMSHSILLPVPPIYAGEFGPPGLIMEDCYTASGAPAGLKRRLLEATESDLVKAGAQIILASSIAGGEWEKTYANQSYEALTLYFAKTDLTVNRTFANVHKATDNDLSAIVASSATNRRILNDLHKLFWKPHKDADDRFGAWMQRSLTLPDRDMFVSRVGGEIQGYAISHPATPLHFPAAHDISGVGVIDDFYHDALENPLELASDDIRAAALFGAAEAARKARGDHSVLVVCPAAWTSKITLLEQAGYKNAITWFIKMVG